MLFSKRKYLRLVVVGLLSSASTISAAASVGTIYLFSFQRSLDPAVADCIAFFEKVESGFPAPSEEYAIRNTAESSCTDGATTDASFHIVLAAEDSTSAAELERYIETTEKIDLWGSPVRYRVARSLVQTISVDAVFMDANENKLARVDIEHVVLVHEQLGRAIDIFKGFRNSFVRGDVTHLIDFLELLSTKTYSEFILSRSNVIEAYVSTVAVIDDGRIHKFPETRRYVRDCGISSERTCVDAR